MGFIHIASQTVMRVGGAENWDCNWIHDAQAQRFVRERGGWGIAVQSQHTPTHTHRTSLVSWWLCREIRQQVRMALRPLPSVILVVTFLFGYANGEFLLDPTPPWIVSYHGQLLGLATDPFPWRSWNVYRTKLFHFSVILRYWWWAPKSRWYRHIMYAPLQMNLSSYSSSQPFHHCCFFSSVVWGARLHP